MSTPVETGDAWRTFSDWKAQHREVGVMFFSSSGTILFTVAVIDLLQRGGLRMTSNNARLMFNLRGASFSYGTVRTWPRWPLPPIVEMIAMQAQLPSGDWLVLAEGVRPELLPPPTPGSPSRLQ